MEHSVGKCGITFEKFQDIKEGDIVEAYLSWSRSRSDDNAEGRMQKCRMSFARPHFDVQ